MSFILEDLIYNPDLYNFALPFLLVFAIVFAILEKTKILGTEADGGAKKGINAVVALVFGLLLVTQLDIVEELHNFIPKVSFFLVIAVMLLLMWALFGWNVGAQSVSGTWKAILFIGSLIVLYWALGPTLGFYFPPQLEDILYTTQWLPLVLLILGVLGVMGVIGKKTGEAIGGKIGKGGSPGGVV